jgi:hypothetical protein
MSLWLDPLRREDFPTLPVACGAEIAGHLFDRTPGHLIKGIVTENGIISPRECGAVFAGLPVSQRLCQKLRNRAYKKN